MTNYSTLRNQVDCKGDLTTKTRPLLLCKCPAPLDDCLNSGVFTALSPQRLITWSRYLGSDRSGCVNDSVRCTNERCSDVSASSGVLIQSQHVWLKFSESVIMISGTQVHNEERYNPTSSSQLCPGFSTVNISPFV